MTARYEIRIQGELPADWADWFDGAAQLIPADDETVLRGEFDQAGLHGVLRRLSMLNLTLIAVRRTPNDKQSGPLSDPVPD